MYRHFKEFTDWLVAVRRDFHQNPELSMRESRSTRKIASTLRELGWEIATFPDMPGVVGVMKGTKPGPTLALRADMDALPVQEQTGASYASKIPGVMHACGHDAHMAILLGVAKKVAETGVMSRVEGNLKLIFQPAEETLAGARALIARGVLENPRVDAICALHVGPHIPAGKVGLYGELAYASTDAFGLVVKGAGTHGARPDEGRDPITASAHFITAIQTIVSRNVKPIHAAVVSVGSIHGGKAPNIIPESVTLQGTIRTLDPDVRETVLHRLKEIAKGISEAFEMSHTLKITEGTPVIRNHPEMARLFRLAAERALGRDNIIEEPPTMGGEDFAFYAERCPAAIVRLGCGNEEKGMTYPLHSPRFDLDERALEMGVHLFLELIRAFFEERRG